MIRALSPLIMMLVCARTQAGIIQLSTSKFGAHYGYLRHLEAQESSDPAFAEGVKTLKALSDKFPDKITMRSGKTYEAKEVGQDRIRALYWRSLDVLAYSSTDLAMLRMLPERIGKPIGGYLDMKEAVKAIETALGVTTKLWETAWEKFRLELKSQQQVWENVYGGRADRDLRDIAKRLGLSKTPEKIEIVILPYAGGAEGMTLQTMDGWKVVIGSQTHQSSAFAEVVLHEATHVMDLLSGENSFLGRLRKALSEAKRSDQEVEQIPHVLIFMAAAAQIQSREANHRPVGEVTGAYKRLPDKLVLAAKAGFEKLPDEAAAIKAILEKIG